MTKTIINTRKHDLVTERKVRLRPGENVLGEEKYSTLSGSKAAKLWRRLGWIKVKPAAAKPTDMAEDLDAGDETGDGDTTPPGAMSAKEAIEFVGNCSDDDVLKEMQDSEERKTVLAAIEKRLAALAEARGPVGGGEGDESGDGDSDDAEGDGADDEGAEAGEG